jgi:hypothetical protein
MTTTTYSEFNQETEGLEVAKAFAGQISGKTILVTGVNRGGIGFSTSLAFVSRTSTGSGSPRLTDSQKGVSIPFPAHHSRS